MTSIMIVDDEALMRRGLATLIDWDSLGCKVVASVENGQLAVEAYKRQPPQIIITDIRMPVMDGLALCKWLHDNHSSAKIILLTAFADFSYAQKAISFGVSEYVTKTGDLDQIVAAVKKCQAELDKEQAAADANAGSLIALLRSILDGSLLGAEAIAARAQQQQLHLNLFYLVLVDTTQAEPLAEGELSQLRLHAQKLFDTEFKQEQHYLVPLDNARFCMVLGASPNCDPQSTLSELGQMFHSLTKRQLYIALSRNHRTAQELRPAFEEAEDAMSLGFYDKATLHHFRSRTAMHRMKEESGLLDMLGDGLRTGDSAFCRKALEEIFIGQLAIRLPQTAVRQTGELVFNACRRALNRVGLGLETLNISEEAWKRSLQATKFYEDCCALQRALVATTCKAVEDALHSGSNIVVNAQYYIDEHFCEPITLKEIAEAVKSNPSYLSRCFKQKTGATIVDTLAQKRIAYAKRLIENGRLKVYEIAEAVGFEDTTYFSHVFRKWTGMSAKEYHDAYIKSQQ